MIAKKYLISLGLLAIVLGLWMVGFRSGSERLEKGANDTEVSGDADLVQIGPGASVRSDVVVDASTSVGVEPDLLTSYLSSRTGERDGRLIDPSDFETAELMLKSYWGDDWGAVKGELEGLGVDLDNYPLGSLKKFSNLEVEISEMLMRKVQERKDRLSASLSKWNSPEAALDEVFGGEDDPKVGSRPILTETQRESVRIKLRDYNEQIRRAAENLNSGLEVTLLEAVSRADMASVHPIISPRSVIPATKVDAGKYVWYQNAAYSGWCLEIGFHVDDYPSFGSWAAEIAELVELRNEYILGLQ